MNQKSIAKARKRYLGKAAFFVAVFGYGGFALAANPPGNTTELAAAVCKDTAAHLHCGDGLVAEINNTGNVSLKGTVVNGDTVVSGSFKAANAKLNTLQVAGWSNLEGTVVNGAATITGSTKLHDSQFDKSLHVTGNFNSEHDTFLGDVAVTGKLKLEGSEVHGALIAASKEVYISGSQINKLDLKASGGVKTKQVVYLQDHSTVAGDINFASGSGVVFVGAGSVIKGQVIGGEVLEAG